MSTINNDLFIWVAVIGLLPFAFGFALGFAFGFGKGTRVKEQEAVRAGVAEWMADRDGKPSFKWEARK